MRSYVGTAEGTGAFVSVVVDGSRALAYVCDGVPADPVGTPPTIQAWFNGPSDGRTVDVQQPAGRLQLQLTGTEMSGTLTLTDGRQLPVEGESPMPTPGSIGRMWPERTARRSPDGFSPPTVSSGVGSVARAQAPSSSPAFGR